jgi:hypothetical protein
MTIGEIIFLIFCGLFTISVITFSVHSLLTAKNKVFKDRFIKSNKS